MADLKFDLDDALNISDLRKISLWEPRLSKIGKLRLQRNGEVLGVLVSPSEWRALAERAQAYERAFRAIEDARDRRIIAEREDGDLLIGDELDRALGVELTEAGLL
jgi:hypothetical protein